MPQDFAKKTPRQAPKKRVHAAGRGKSGDGPSASAWFFSGLLCGVFLCGLAWLASSQPELEEAVATIKKAASSDPAAGDSDGRKPRFDFYTLLPKQTLDVDVDPGNIDQARVDQAMHQLLLQAGSFKQAEDADRRRAELLLLGLDARVAETQGDNGRWYRVYIGPFESRSKLAKARSLTAQQGIDTLLLKQPAQG